jgi:guanylate kinase
MLVLSSPSGAGKSTISRALLDSEPDLALSVSVTTRAPRPGEDEAIHYFFRSIPQVETMVEQKELLEWAKVFDNYYGTPRQPVEDALSQGRDVMFDIDWQGNRQLRDNAPDDLVSIFILPPSLPELERRLTARGQDSAEVIAKRMAKAMDEISHWSEYDYCVVNHDLETSIAQVRAILHAERQKRQRQVALPAFIESFTTA